MEDLDMTMEEYVQYETEKALRNGKFYNWETATYGKINYIGDINYLIFFETKFPTIVSDDALSSKPTLSSQHVDKVNWKMKHHCLNMKMKNMMIKNIDGKINMPRRNVTWEHQEKASNIDQTKSDNASVDDGNKNYENGIKNMGDKNSDVFGWEDPKVQPMKPSFVNVVTSDKQKPKVNFRTLVNDESVEDSDFVLPLEAVVAAQNKFANSLVGYFVEKTIAFPLVKNYVTNTWAKYGFQKVIKDDDGFYFFKFLVTNET
ncbi:hypothetical protein Tco_0923336 [Tanacetum coccineum]|uniref:Uncharacterized protein n=1 Tax=Tanacetum coccineum TaxID=301880 RepID=A0ABQ5D298_9ASTR